MTASNAISSTSTDPARKLGASADCSSSTADRFALTGPTRPLDPRINAFRHDLADIALAGQVLAPHYARALPRACGAQATPVRAGPSDDQNALSELLPGEGFAVLEYAAGWAWGYCTADAITGYVEAIALGDPKQVTHLVCEKTAPVTAGGALGAPLIAMLPMGARLSGAEQGACLATEYGCVSLAHLRRAGEHDEDPVLVAERLIEAPWRAGGRTCHGVDGAGLVQLALSLCGFEAPHLPEQLGALGEPLAESARLRRGDIVAGTDVIGLMVDDLMMIHASAAAGKVTVEPVAVVAADSIRRRLAL